MEVQYLKVVLYPPPTHTDALSQRAVLYEPAQTPAPAPAPPASAAPPPGPAPAAPPASRPRAGPQLQPGHPAAPALLAVRLGRHAGVTLHAHTLRVSRLGREQEQTLMF